jgi:hypothetical protein
LVFNNAKYEVQIAFNFLRISDPYAIAPNLIIFKLQRDIIFQKNLFKALRNMIDVTKKGK